MIKRVEALQKFLKAVERLAKNNDITIDDAYRFAKQQFGEVSDLMKLQINRLFKKKQASGTRDKKEGEVVDFKTSKDQDDFLQRVGRQIEQDRKDLGPIDTKEEGITFSVPEKGIFNQKTSIDEVTEMLTKNPFRPGGGLDPLEGMTRTAARVVLGRRGIKIPDKGDPIDVFEENFGGDALMDLKNVAEELVEKETTGNITESMGKFLDDQGMFDLKVNKDAPKAMSDEELIKKLTDDDPDRTNNAMGGINRVGFARGRIKLLQFLAGKGKTLTGEIRKAVDNIFTTGDKKYDADVVVDDMMETLGIDRDNVDQKDVLDAYDEAYQMLSKGPGSKPIKQGDAITSENFGDSQFAPDTRNLDRAREMTPKMIERFELKEKYPGIDDKLLTQIIDDPDPNNKAQVLATLDQALELQRQGKTPEEAVDILEKGLKTRKDNAEGGLNYLMGM